MTLSLGLVLIALSGPVTGADIAERVQPDLDTFVFCVLDKSVEQLPSGNESAVIARLAAEECLTELKILEEAVASQYREINKSVWPAGLAEQTARENRDEYRRLAIAAAVGVIDERRGSP
ncbi:hypothetical protein H5368_13265 [Luteimonas sp. MC1782]|uniref:hypothetical protein n=1 Tax=Luteimonas sp. MC1782 TaxID=2760305 RepID=UPI0015FEC987|nr:hypothetical protein [Luteimonas sp. MC1782]MBB1473999.1 hypothetical protein [Luteimonas sp. MC1782]